MASYPQIVDYNEVIQHPATAFVDTELKQGRVRQNTLGLPVVLSGAFALTYTIITPQRQLAVRCFHRQIPAADQKYATISKHIEPLQSKYFVTFSYLEQGIRVKKAFYPIVKMAWVEGDPLGIWLDKNAANSTLVKNMRGQFAALAGFLNQKGIAHGDIQNDNVIVSPSGITLIDYDGMYVPGMATGNGNETGHKHFQHPSRAVGHFGPMMDRFSFIALDLSLRAIAEDASLHRRFRDGGETIVFRASDFVDPQHSEIFQILGQYPKLKPCTDNLARICEADIRLVPTLEDFLNGRNIPVGKSITIRSKTHNQSILYRLTGKSTPRPTVLYQRRQSRLQSNQVILGPIQQGTVRPSSGASASSVPSHPVSGSPLAASAIRVKKKDWIIWVGVLAGAALIIASNSGRKSPTSYGQRAPIPIAASVPSAPPKLLPSSTIDPYQRGMADRAALEQWVSGLTGDFRQGVDWWAAHRSVANSGTCSSLTGKSSDFISGCEAARARLTPFDVKRKSDPEYRRGWNTYTSTLPVGPGSAVEPGDASSTVDPYQQGMADRAALEQWVSGLTGDFRQGVDWWAAHRSVADSGTCSSLTGNSSDFMSGCDAARVRLTPFDVKRKSDPEYRRGWNTYTSAPATPPVGVPTPLPQPVGPGSAVEPANANVDSADRLNAQELQGLRGRQ